MNIAFLVFLITLTQAAPHQCSDPARLNRLTSDAKVIALVEITEVERVGAMFWSGNGVTTQHVTYKVKKVLKGALAGRTMKVAHPLYHGSFSADKERPRLSPKLFRQGNTLLLFVGTGKQIMQADDGTAREVEEFMTTDPECGALPADDNLLRAVEKALALDQH